jgi:hypothetical protein
MDGIHATVDLRNFLLKRLPEDESASMEELLITDEAFFHQVQAAEDELIEECALGTLSPDQEEDFLRDVNRQPGLAERLAVRKAFVKALASQSQHPVQKIAAPRSARNRRFLVPGLGIAASLLLVACLLLLRTKHDLQMQLAQRERIHATPVLERSTPLSAAASPVVATVFFPAHAFRGVEEQTALHVGVAPARLLELQLEIPSETRQSPRWTVTITGKKGVLLLQNDLPTQQIGSVSFVRAYMDTSVLEPGQYGVLLSAGAAATSGERMQWTLVASK